MSKTKALYHIVFCTKGREKTIPSQLKPELYRLINFEVQSKNCDLIRIGGIENHVHVLINLHPAVALADLLRHIKATSSGWMRRDPRFSNFKGWATGYFAGTIGPDAEAAVINYINNQEEHHKGRSIADELRAMYHRLGLDFEETEMM